MACAAYVPPAPACRAGCACWLRCSSTPLHSWVDAQPGVSLSGPPCSPARGRLPDVLHREAQHFAPNLLLSPFST